MSCCLVFSVILTIFGATMVVINERTIDNLRKIDPATAFVKHASCRVLGSRLCSIVIMAEDYRRGGRGYSCELTRSYLFEVPGIAGNFTSRNETFSSDYCSDDNVGYGKIHCSFDGMWKDDTGEIDNSHHSSIDKKIHLKVEPREDALFVVGKSYPCYVPAKGIGLLPPEYDEDWLSSLFGNTGQVKIFNPVQDIKELGVRVHLLYGAGIVFLSVGSLLILLGCYITSREIDKNKKIFPMTSETEELDEEVTSTSISGRSEV